MPRTRRFLDSQTLKWEEVFKWDTCRPAPAAVTAPKAETGRPAGTAAPDPYWEFSWQITADSGLKLTDLVARDTLGPGSMEPVAESVDFTDLKIVFSDTPAGDFESFPIAAAFGHKESKFEYGQTGTSTASGARDSRFQHGLLLTLVHEFGGTCKVKLCLSVVFRGAVNDFDPGGIPVSMNFYPQIGYTWERSKGSASTRTVKQFRGSVRITVNNRTPASGSMPAVPENVANFWTDSNISKDWFGNRQAIMLEGLVADVELFIPYQGIIYGTSKPFGWGLVFDYNRMFVTEEQEYDAVYGPLDGVFYSTRRSLSYKWPQSGAVKVNNYKVQKAPRQGYYDNIHLHGRMHHKDLIGNEQIHGPFCGHSCIHLHWRWSSISGKNAVADRGWYYRGWSTGKVVQANSVDDNPLIPPNQKLTVAICQPDRARVSDARILPPAGSRGTLDPLRKLIWYCADVFHIPDAKINAGEQQVIMEHGIGWAFRYALPTDKDTEIKGLLDVFAGEPDPVTQASLMQFFEDKVYPGFRYWRSRGITTNQIPEGTNDDVMTGARRSMESL
jgi:hypothetical protein